MVISDIFGSLLWNVSCRKKQNVTLTKSRRAGVSSRGTKSWWNISTKSSEVKRSIFISRMFVPEEAELIGPTGHKFESQSRSTFPPSLFFIMKSKNTTYLRWKTFITSLNYTTLQIKFSYTSIEWGLILDTITQLHKSRHGWMITESYREHDSGL